ncbi:bifunctional 5,10-methylene-tetrahydrofolate dehydrogenase/5,10-methylene-tetrahydrofolate cyclohydrolase [candidate division KSB1 bacterium]|nr:bifunctional 5,10-methylene-tetrahydrofolate dehydrogenase/5,10-methylene-tetrahydrofolate cyclohydrolase [candidate division KSB1 bacterium]MBL7094276.1 bifunctional 5,10-methylene-tetrahydrofolate dehydrogenase/5,10-methylene-tetrahydrofolate cyclohydrolase [candidate division KSB1 bacterium]
MSAQIINGKEIAAQIKIELKQEIEKLKGSGITPGLATVLVGDDPASAAYVRMKGKMCEKLGIHNESIKLSSDISEEKLLSIINDLANDLKINGILVQLPLPEHISEQNIIKSIPLHKDVDGFHPHTWGKMMTGEDTFLPCTPAGIQEMLIRSGNNPEKKHVVIAGRSKIVGLPLANILIKKEPGANATVTVCHTGTQNMSQITKQADILIAAIGRPEVITADVVNENAVVIDVGVNRVEAPETERGYRLVGDVHFETVSQKVKAISPVPGGVGPMTIIMLMKNTVKAAKLTT